MPETPVVKPAIGHAALRRARVSLPGHIYHVTTTTAERWRFFADFRTARLAIRAIHAPGVRADSDLLAWVLMPDHLHALVQIGIADSLPRLMERVKSATGRAVNRHLGRSGSVWQRAYHDHLLRKEEDLRVVGRYLIANPLRAGLVDRVSRYPHWDAVWV